MLSRADFFKQYKGVGKSIRLYWQLYGGWTDLLTSPYLHLALVLSLLSFHLWLPEKPAYCWHEMPISVLPNLLGFTLGGYAILLAFGNEKFLSSIGGADEDGKPSPYLKINGSFVHYIIIQVISLLFSLLSKSFSINRGLVALIGLTIFYYAILSSLMATFAILNISKWFDIFIKHQKKHPKENNSTNDKNPTQ